MNNLIEDNLSGLNHGKLFPNNPLKFLTTSSIVGDKVHNKKGEHMGVIKDIMVDINDGKIEFYVIEFGGFLGIGVKYFAIPFRLLTVDAKNNIFILDQKREMMEKAPGFDLDHWPDTNTHFEEVLSYWSFMGN